MYVGDTFIYPLQVDGFSVGDKVLTIAGKDKQKYHDMMAEVMVVKKASCRVKLLSGPAVGTMKDYQNDKLKKQSEEGGSSGSGGGDSGSMWRAPVTRRTRSGCGAALGCGAILP